MSSLPNEIFTNITDFLPNDDITDLMFLSKKFNALVTPRLQKIDEEMTTMNQSIKSFMPVSTPDTDNTWITQLNLKRFKPIGSNAKKRMKEVFEKRVVHRNCICDIHGLEVVKKGMSLERFDFPTFLRILGALIATLKFCQEYNFRSISISSIETCFFLIASSYPNVSFVDVERILSFYNNE
ncbi:hypothetical protein Ddc_18514 [Ditylenchus destructor]|nr:hypothetical protein Ddc_18514 [Ditylenchus destructor]